MKVVLDTNVVVSAVINLSGTPASVLGGWRSGHFTWVISEALITELDRIVHSPRVNHLVRLPESEVMALFDRMRRTAEIVEPARLLEVIADDPDDNRVLEAAVEGQADYIVSGDRHLLALGEYEGVQIVTPARFLAIIRSGGIL